jgi:hypothetical protein
VRLPAHALAAPVFHVAARTVVLDRLRVAARALHRDTYALEELLDEVVRPDEALRAVDVHKRRARYDIGGCMAERTRLRTDAARRARSRSSPKIPSSWSTRCGRSASQLGRTSAWRAG